MKMTVWIVSLLLCFTALARANGPTTQASQTVHVNGLDFQMVAATTWVVPTDKTPTTVPLSLKITNPSDKDMRLTVYGSPRVTLKDDTGKALACGGGCDGTRAMEPPLLVAKGQSVTIDRTARFGPDPRNPGTWQLLGSDETGAWWQFDALKPGKYTIGMTYENTRDTEMAAENAAQPPIWVGKAVTKELAVEITIGISSKPVEKDGLQATVNLPKVSFTPNEPLKFTVDFKNVSKESLSLDNARMFWDWTIRFENVQTKGPWQLHETFIGGRTPMPTNNGLKPGETFSVPVEVDPAKKFFEYVWKGEQSNPVQPVRQLPPGKYRLTIDIVLNENPNHDELTWPVWTGKITTEPVEFQITDKEAASPLARSKVNEKGWELRVWQDNGQTQYALLSGTNRVKTDKEIAQAAVNSLDAIEKQLDELKDGQDVFFMGRVQTDKPSEAAAIDDLIKYCNKIGLQVLMEK